MIDQINLIRSKNVWGLHHGMVSNAAAGNAAIPTGVGSSSCCSTFYPAPH